jgi:hypothetical protein
LMTSELSGTYACTGAMLGFTSPTGNGLTATVPRKAGRMNNPTEIPLIVEGKRDTSKDPGNPSKACRSNYPWKTSSVNYGAELTTANNTSELLHLDFRHGSKDSMEVLYADYSVRALKFQVAKTSLTQTNWDNPR